MTRATDNRVSGSTTAAHAEIFRMRPHMGHHARAWQGVWLLGLATGYELMPVKKIKSLERFLRDAVDASTQVRIKCVHYYYIYPPFYYLVLQNVFSC